MATFSKKERLIASLLSATPGLKAFLKNAYISFNAILYKKKYSVNLLKEPVEINIKDPLDSYDSKSETFGGYYDISTINSKGEILSHVSPLASTNLPSPKIPVSIVLTDMKNGITTKIAESTSYNWQQGTRLQWITEDLFAFNDFNNISNTYETKVFSRKENAEIKCFEKPIQACFKDEYFLSINYRRLQNMCPDYGYQNLPLLTKVELSNLENDGIWKTDFATGETHLLHSLKEIVQLEKKAIFDICTHKINHLIIRPDGTGFMFIHRYFKDRRRYDRLLYSDFKTIKVLIDEEYVSHCFWMDNENILGYFRANGRNGYYSLSITGGNSKLCPEMTNLNLGDGHPSCYKEWVVFDSYPDKSRMQKLLLMNFKTKKLYCLAEVFQSTKYKNETRCDLHPRFSCNGEFISFDTVYKDKRRQMVIDINPIISI